MFGFFFLGCVAVWVSGVFPETCWAHSICILVLSLACFLVSNLVKFPPVLRLWLPFRWSWCLPLEDPNLRPEAGPATHHVWVPFLLFLRRSSWEASCSSPRPPIMTVLRFCSFLLLVLWLRVGFPLFHHFTFSPFCFLSPMLPSFCGFLRSS